ncbi:hypothetical protein Tco_0363177 [Tanacetum coccineum]
MSSSNAKVQMIGRRYINKAFKDSNRYEHVRLKFSVWESKSERRSQTNGVKGGLPACSRGHVKVLWDSGGDALLDGYGRL